MSDVIAPLQHFPLARNRAIANIPDLIDGSFAILILFCLTLALIALPRQILAVHPPKIGAQGEYRGLIIEPSEER